jgi:hypothetical protein
MALLSSAQAPLAAAGNSLTAARNSSASGSVQQEAGFRVTHEVASVVTAQAWANSVSDGIIDTTAETLVLACALGGPTGRTAALAIARAASQGRACGT